MDFISISEYKICMSVSMPKLDVLLFYTSIHVQSGVATSETLIPSQGPALSSHTMSASHTAQKFTELKPKVSAHHRCIQLQSNLITMMTYAIL